MFVCMANSMLFAQSSVDNIKSDIAALEKLQKVHDGYNDTLYSFIYNKLSDKSLQIDEKALWHCYMSRFLYDYLRRNAFSISDRTNLEVYDEADFSTWSTIKFVSEIIAHSLKSIEKKEILQTKDVKGYLTLMNRYDDSQMLRENIDSFLVCRPTLYDCLAQEAVSIFTETSAFIPQPIQEFDINNPDFFAANDKFAALKIDTPDSLSFRYMVLSLLQELTKFHLKSGYDLALLEVTLQRVNYLKSESTLDNTEKLVLDLLMKLEKDYKGKAGYADVCCALGDFYKDNATENDVNDENRFYLRTAIEWYDKAVVDAPNTVAGIMAKKNMEDIKKQTITVSLPQKPIPQDNLLTYMYRNCNDIYVRILALSSEEVNALMKKVDYDERKLYAKLVQNKYLKEWHRTLANPGDYREHFVDGVLPALPVGEYTLMVSAEPFSVEEPKGFSYANFTVSNIGVLKREVENDGENAYEIMFYDLTTGAPLQNRKVDVEYRRDFSASGVKKKFATNVKGIVSIPEIKDYHLLTLTLKEGEDKFSEDIWYVSYNNYPVNDTSVVIYTDRAIYRPGQTIYFKGIAVASAERTNEVVPNRQFKVDFVDANYEQVASVELKTNEFGSFNGSFEVPTGALTGSYHIIVGGYGGHYIYVEEYKRPQFEVVIKTPEDDYRLNDKVGVSGAVTAYSGYPLADAEVSYRVVRQAKFPYISWWTRVPVVPQKEIAHGKVKTAQDGSFSFDFIAEEAKVDYKNPLYHFEIKVDATDINGETHSAKQTVVVGKQALQLEVDVPYIIDNEKDNVNIPLSAKNLGGVAQVVDVSYKIEYIETPSVFMHNRPNVKPDVASSDSDGLKSAFPHIALNDENIMDNWKVLEVVRQGSLKTENEAAVKLTELKQLHEGAYKITVSATDKYGEKVSRTEYFFIHSSKSKRSSVFAALTVQPDKTTVQPGDVVTVSIGSYLNEADVYLEVISNASLIYSEWLVLKRGQTQCEIPVTDDMRGNIVVSAFLADKGFNYSETATIEVPFTNKVVNFEWGAFRDKTTPGNDEEITLKIKGANGDKIAAELLCSMYDASLDAFAPNAFNLVLDYLNLNYDLSPFANARSFEYVNSFYEDLSRVYYDYAYKTYYSLNTDFLSERMYYRKLYKMSGRSSGAVYSLDGKIAATMPESARNDNLADAAIEKADVLAVEEKAQAEEMENVQVRSDFAETAFFYPDLRTDADGSVVIKFKMPESLTKWKMLGLAHTADMSVGTFEKYIQTIKDMMVVPNVPRFLREGDTVVLSAKIVNTGKVNLSGNVALDFYNASDNVKQNIVVGNASQPFAVAAGESAEVSFKVLVPHNVPALTYKFSARSLPVDGLTYSDGESATLPVLSNRMLVTESINLYVNGSQAKKFEFKTLEDYLRGTAPKTREHYNLKLELTPNPMWYAVQALPYLMQYPYECNEQMFSKLYANSLAAHIVKSSPEIEKTFNEWKNVNPDVLQSNLEKNEDLKYALLEETPWVQDAKSETAQKNNISMLFDSRRIAKENRKAVAKLEKNQNPDGSWSWFGTGYPNRFITQHIVAGSGHLICLGVDDIGNLLSDRSLRNAVKFMDNQLSTDYRQLKIFKADLSKVYPSQFQIHYFYARSFFIDKNKISKNDQEAYDFYLGQMKKSWSEESVYMQAMIALVMYRNGDTELAKKIINDIKQRAIYSDEMGMYWKRDGSGWYWYEAQVERQALLIEAFLTITNDTESAEKMQLWLLKQKQTQNWGTTKNTAEACYALFMQNGLKVKEMTRHNPIAVSLIDTVIVVEDNPAAPTVMQNVPLHDKDQVRNTSIMLTKTDEGSAWGGLYWQYFDELENIEATEKNVPLSMVKQLYKVELGSRGETLVPVSAKKPIRVGDKIRVRVELRADRDFEFVHLKDMRAAAFEPTDVFSGYRRHGDMFYYESVRDASVNFFFDVLKKGTYVFEYTLVASQAGTFSNGISTVQCMYAPQFSAHSKGLKVTVVK